MKLSQEKVISQRTGKCNHIERELSQKMKLPTQKETVSSKGEIREQTQNPPTLHKHARARANKKSPPEKVKFVVLQNSVARGGSAITSCRHAA
jgi:hypothetical protein